MADLTFSLITLSVFTTNGTYVKIASTNAVDILLIGGGGGGGGGENNGSATGGLGGCPGNVLYLKKYPTQFLSTSVNFTVGIGGLGGPTQNGNNKPGNPGSVGTASIFGTFIAQGGCGGIGGASGVAIGTYAGLNTLYDYTSDCLILATGLYGSNSSIIYNTSLNFDQTNSGSIFLLPTGGGAGSITQMTTFYSANSSGSIFCPFLNYSTTIAQVSLQTGLSGSTYASYYGCGGAGGNGTSIGAAGGAGGLYGGGGGGGSADSNPPPKSGGGGNGANGVIVVAAYNLNS